MQYYETCGSNPYNKKTLALRVIIDSKGQEKISRDTTLFRRPIGLHLIRSNNPSKITVALHLGAEAGAAYFYISALLFRSDFCIPFVTGSHQPPVL